MKRIIATALLALAFSVGANAQIDTVYISDLYTTHLIFDTDVSYADLSNQVDIAGKIIEQAKNKIAVKARNPFTTVASISAEEANGVFHTYILKYAKYPADLIVDKRKGKEDRIHILDTLYLSTSQTTHILFATDVMYADISNPKSIVGKLVEQGKNKLAIRAKEPFEQTASIAAEEANGIFHTYILKYDENPVSLVLDTKAQKGGIAAASGETGASSSVGGSRVANTSPKLTGANTNAYGGISANVLKQTDAPLLSEIIKLPQGLYHLNRKEYKVRLSCENIFSYSDITYFTLSLENGSQISYETEDATFVIESRNGSKRKVYYETNVYPKSKFGTLTAPAGGNARIVYSFDKMTLSNDQVLKIYLYEKGGQRNIELSLSAKDVNSAIAPTK